MILGIRSMSLVVAAVLATITSSRAASPSPQSLADRIDARLASKFAETKAILAPQADDAEFLRRASLDVTGRIPSAAEFHAFIADKDRAKRSKLIDNRIDTPRYAEHFANVWRAQLVPEVTASVEARYFQPGFEAWLKQKLRAGVGYDAIVRELLAVPFAGSKETVDRNGNGLVSRQEFLGSSEAFKLLDTNGDDFIRVSEAEAADRQAE